MQFLKRALLLVLASFLFAACADDVTNNNYYGNGGEGSFNVNISDSDYEIVVAHKSYYNPNYTPTGYSSDYYTGMKLVIKLSDPSKRGEVNRLVMAYSNFGYDFNKQELDQAYADSIGGYVFDFINLEQLGSYSSVVWTVKLYDASNNSSNGYPLATVARSLSLTSASNSWVGAADLEIALSSYNAYPEAGAIAETHFLDTDGEEIAVSHSSIRSNRWTVNSVPSDAVYFYYIVTDKYSGINRRFISGKNSITNRLPDNVEFIAGGSNASKILYLENLNKVLTLSITERKLTLINYDDNSIAWEKTLPSSPVTYAYSAERGVIYLVYTEGDVDSVNPADGSGKRLFSGLYNASALNTLLVAGDYLFFFWQYSNSYQNYNLTRKQFSNQLEYSAYNVYDAKYDAINNRIYVREDWRLYLYSIDNSGTLSLFSDLYNSNSSSSPRLMTLSPDAKKLYCSEGYIYTTPTGYSTSFTQSGSINPFNDLTFVSDQYIAAINETYSQGSSIFKPALTLYNSNAQLLGKVTGLIGTPKRIFSKGTNLKIYSVQSSGSLIAQTYTVDEIINASGKINANGRKIYFAKKM